MLPTMFVTTMINFLNSDLFFGLLIPGGPFIACMIMVWYVERDRKRELKHKK